ncbi:MAG: PQQ-binding-like beta-propeller repeat protein [Candidatus ainarchaeum sp.]|nr:PQQ-binding-like beta-propeller repeat protein [Candidatus ainarchaeum sp.]
MAEMKNLLIFFLFFVIFSNAEGWVNTFDSYIQTDVLVYSGNIIFGDADGTVYMFGTNGNLVWKKTELEDIADMGVIGNKIIVISNNGTIYNMDGNGYVSSKNELNVQVYGAYFSDSLGYITTKNGVYSYNGNSAEWIFKEGGSYTPPLEYQGNIIFGKNQELYSITKSGTVMWKTALGPFWNSKPNAYGNIIFIGSLNHYFYAVDATTGSKIWFFGTDGGITSGSVVSGGTIIFGSNDGYVYALDMGDGKLRWKGKTNGGIFATPELSTIGSENVILVGSTDAYMYGFKRNNGELVWGYPVTEPVYSLEVYGDQIFAATTNKVYSIPTDRSCIILEPSDRAKVGYREVKITGKVFSRYGNAQALISVNGGIWEKVEIDENENFVYYLDPNPYSFGSLEVQCKVADSAGQSLVPTKLILIRSTEFSKPEFDLKYSGNVKEGGLITINVFDKETGEAVNDFDYKIEDKTSKGSGSVNITAGSSGKIEILFSKSGYESKKAIVNVEMDFIPYILGVVVIVIVAFFVWFKFIRKKPVEE